MLPTNPVDATLPCGALVSKSIDSPAQVDQFTFSCQNNDRVTLTLASVGFSVGSGASATATVFSPSAAVVVTFNANGQQQVTLPETGTYGIQTRVSNCDSFGSYTIGRVCLLPTNPVDATLPCGALVSKSIDSPPQVDQFPFSGFFLMIRPPPRSTLFPYTTRFPSATATVFSPSAAVVVTFNANGQQQVTLPETG